jgi:hypothetical protein
LGVLIVVACLVGSYYQKCRSVTVRPDPPAHDKAGVVYDVLGRATACQKTLGQAGGMHVVVMIRARGRQHSLHVGLATHSQE